MKPAPKGAPAAGITVLVVMGAVIAWAVLTGDFRAEGRALVSMPWGVTTLVDLYSGLGLVAAWVLYVEGAGLRAGGWIVALLCLGNVATALFVLYRVAKARGDGARFFLGERNG